MVGSGPGRLRRSMTARGSRGRSAPSSSRSSAVVLVVSSNTQKARKSRSALHLHCRQISFKYCTYQIRKHHNTPKCLLSGPPPSRQVSLAIQYSLIINKPIDRKMLMQMLKQYAVRRLSEVTIQLTVIVDLWREFQTEGPAILNAIK